MANTSLQTYMDANPGKGPVESATEVLLTEISGLVVGNSSAAADPGSNATKALAVQFVTGGKPLISKPVQYTGVPSSAAILSADGTVFTLAAGEIGFIQVLSADAPLAVKFGASASTISLNLILPASVADSDGSGGAIWITGWVGAVSVAKMAGASKYLAWKQAA